MRELHELCASAALLLLLMRAAAAAALSSAAAAAVAPVLAHLLRGRRRESVRAAERGEEKEVASPPPPPEPRGALSVGTHEKGTEQGGEPTAQHKAPLRPARCPVARWIHAPTRSLARARSISKKRPLEQHRARSTMTEPLQRVPELPLFTSLLRRLSCDDEQGAAQHVRAFLPGLHAGLSSFRPRTPSSASVLRSHAFEYGARGKVSVGAKAAELVAALSPCLALEVHRTHGPHQTDAFVCVVRSSAPLAPAGRTPHSKCLPR